MSTLDLVRDKQARIFSPLRQKYLVETPEERVRQEYLCTLVNQYGFSLDQIDEEVSVIERGSGKARADFLIWRDAKDKAAKAKPLIVVECKADNVTIDARTYVQGANYAQYVQARFFVTHNNRETKYWRVDHTRMMPNFDEIEDIPHADASDKEIEALVARLKVFKEDEFADLLHQCHNVIRNREAHDPTKAFDETAKILFVKVWVERELKEKRQRKNLFSVDFLDSQLSDDPLNDLFEKTKKHYAADALFAASDEIELKPETGKAIVKLLERYNLSDTSEDIKGIAFERFLGKTFRGEIGQFFTPRPIVEFMIRMVEPKEGETVCDPAAGSGGFLIRFFELVREQILVSADAEYRVYAASVAEDTKLSEAERAKRLTKKYADIQTTLDARVEGSRLWKLSNRCIYGTDKNDRMARTSKMNMIMHGDGHGGVHHWNGFLNVNGIFDGRFDVVLANPPFGAKVEADERVMEKEIALAPEHERRYGDIYGEPYRAARAALKAAAKENQSIASLFKLPASAQAKIKTEVLFIERCLDLLKPGGRLGLVLPEGIFNNPSLSSVRAFVEDRAYLKAVVSLPQETFVSSGASVKASLLFLEKFTVEQQAGFDALKALTLARTEARHADALAALTRTLARPRLKWNDFSTEKKPSAETKRKAELAAAAANVELAALKKAAENELKALHRRIAIEARAELKRGFDYPVFLYEAEQVGITATGEADDNELYPNPRLPKGIERSALEQYFAFRENPEPFFV